MSTHPSEVPYESFAASIQQNTLFWHALFEATMWKNKTTQRTDEIFGSKSGEQN